MSDTAIDMNKVTQMLDAGWEIHLDKNDLGSYTASGRHENPDVWWTARKKWIGSAPEGNEEIAEITFGEDVGEIDTDDFTAGQALTRLAYKVHGECI